MKNATILVLIVAVVGLCAAHSKARSDLSDLPFAAEVIEEQVVDKLIHAKGEPNGPSPPDCCNECGACDRRSQEYARCQCLDLSTKCHPSCKYCVRAKQLIEPPLYRCLDMNFISYFACLRPCTSTTSKLITN